MKILELTRLFYPSIGGMEKFVANRLKIYRALGCDYQVITTNSAGAQIEKPKIKKDVISLNSFTHFVVTPGLKNVLKLNYDILSVNEVGYYYSYYAVKHAFNAGKKIILTPHYYFHTGNYRFVKKMHKKYVLPKILGMVDKIIVFTKSEKRFWTDSFPFTQDKIDIIPHYFAPDKEVVMNNIIDNEFFLYLGRGGRNKRTDLLIKAFCQIESFNYKLFLTLSENELSDAAKECVNLSDKIELLGCVSEEYKHQLLSECSALVFPTDYEAFGIVNFEASFYKKPLIVTNLKIFNEILNNKGIIYFENAVDDIKKKILEFIKLTPKKRREMGEYNFNNLKGYTFSKAKDKYEQLFKELI